MSKRLRDNINSGYIAAADKLRSKDARRRIVAYVESYDDVLFWRSVLGQFEDKTRYFEVMLPSKVSLSKGKKQVLMNLLRDQGGQQMIACVDADYDYLLQGATEVSRQVIGNPYVFHTYAYAIENMQSYAPSLHEVCVMATLNDHQLFDFERHLSQFSQAIFPLFVWNIWHYRQGCYGDFTMTDFNRVIETGAFNLENPEAALARVRRKVTAKVRQLQREHPDAKESYLGLKNELKQLGVTADTTYLYIQGHHLFDNLVAPMLSKICDRLRRERELEIHQKAVHDTQKRNELSCYTHSIEDVRSMLRRNTGYKQSPPYRRLLSDLEAFLAAE